MIDEVKVNEFQELTLIELENITGIDSPRWSRYLSGKVSINTRTLKKAASNLGMQPQALLYAIEIRNHKKTCVTKQVN
mgnify:CR=1 FL=1